MLRLRFRRHTCQGFHYINAPEITWPRTPSSVINSDHIPLRLINAFSRPTGGALSSCSVGYITIAVRRFSYWNWRIHTCCRCCLSFIRFNIPCVFAAIIERSLLVLSYRRPEKNTVDGICRSDHCAQVLLMYNAALGSEASEYR